MCIRVVACIGGHSLSVHVIVWPFLCRHVIVVLQICKRFLREMAQPSKQVRNSHHFNPITHPHRLHIIILANGCCFTTGRSDWTVTANPRPSDGQRKNVETRTFLSKLVVLCVVYWRRGWYANHSLMWKSCSR